MADDEPEVVHLDMVEELIDGAEAVEVPPAEVKAAPGDLPIICLGVNGDVMQYLDTIRQLRPLKQEKHSKLNIAGLFMGHKTLLPEIWPKRNKEGQVNGWSQQDAAEDLFDRCQKQGVWNAQERVRGAGAWLGESGELVLHCGDRIWRGPPAGDNAAYEFGQWQAPGIIGRMVYPTTDVGPKPAVEADAGGMEAAAEFLTLVNSWNWQLGETASVLCIGWIGAAMLAGALKWRPIMYVTGGTGTGKSTLQDVLREVFDGAAVVVSDASAAGIWQKLGHQTVPVLIDEMEAEADSRQANKLIKLAREASSGGFMLRGGADHVPTEFVARSCFAFFSILVPSMTPQDRSRLALLELKDLTGGAPPVIRPDKLRDLGGRLRRRLVDRWHDLPALLMNYRVALEETGHTKRGAEQFGTLLAIADLLMHDGEPDSDYIREWATKMSAHDMAEWDDEQKDEASCLVQLLTSVADVYRAGSRSLISDWIEQAAAGEDFDESEAQKVLVSYGLKVVTLNGRKFLAVANKHKALNEIFNGTHWAGRSGGRAVWVQSLRRLPGAERSVGNVRFGPMTGRATMIPVELAVTARPVRASRAGEDIDG